MQLRLQTAPASMCDLRKPTEARRGYDSRTYAKLRGLVAQRIASTRQSLDETRQAKKAGTEAPAKGGRNCRPGKKGEKPERHADSLGARMSTRGCLTCYERAGQMSR